MSFVYGMGSMYVQIYLNHSHTALVFKEHSGMKDFIRVPVMLGFPPQPWLGNTYLIDWLIVCDMMHQHYIQIQYKLLYKINILNIHKRKL